MTLISDNVIQNTQPYNNYKITTSPDGSMKFEIQNIEYEYNPINGAGNASIKINDDHGFSINRNAGGSGYDVNIDLNRMGGEFTWDASTGTLSSAKVSYDFGVAGGSFGTTYKYEDGKLSIQSAEIGISLADGQVSANLTLSDAGMMAHPTDPFAAEIPATKVDVKISAPFFEFEASTTFTTDHLFDPELGGFLSGGLLGQAYGGLRHRDRQIEEAINGKPDYTKLNREGKHYYYDPLIIDLDGDGIETISHQNGKGAYFDNDADGIRVATGWVSSDDGILAFDRNGDGFINDGSEIFGDNTKLSDGTLARNGFEALKDLDSNGDGKIDSNDTSFSQLKIWRDLNQDGISQQDELQNLEFYGITELNLDYVNSNELLNGNNILAQKGSYIKSDGSIGFMGDVNFSFNNIFSQFTQQMEVSQDVSELVNLKGSGRVRELQQAMMISSSLKDIVTQYLKTDSPILQQELLPKLIREWAKTDPYFSDYTENMWASMVSSNREGLAIAGSSSGTIISFDKIDEDVQSAFNLAKTKIGILDSFYGTKTTKLFYVNEKDILNSIDVINSSYANIINIIEDSLYSYSNVFLKYYDEIDFVYYSSNGHSEYYLDFSKVLNIFESELELNSIHALNNIYNFIAYISEEFPNEKKVNFDQLYSLIYKTLENLSNEELSILEHEGRFNTLFKNLILGSDEGNELAGSTTSDTLLGLKGDDKLYGGSGADTLIGGTGNDYLEGGYHGDTYVFSKGHGQDVIAENSGGTAGDDTIQFTDVNYASVSFRRETDDLLLFGYNEGDSVRIKNFFAHSYHELEKFVFNDQTITLADFRNNGMTFHGTEGNETITTWAYKSTVLAGAGNDSVTGSGQADTLDGGAGDDKLYGGSGADTLIGGEGNDILNGGAGADTAIFKLLSGFENDAVGGNGVDTWTDFNLSHGDKINISDLLIGDVTAENISEYIKIESLPSSNTFKLSVDRDGVGNTYSYSELLVADSNQKINTLDDLLKNNALIY